MRAIAAMVVAAQAYVREKEGDPSVVSLRDVKRVLDLVRFFIVAVAPADVERPDKDPKAPLGVPVALAVAHVYLFRLPTTQLRNGLWIMLRASLRGISDGDPSKLPASMGQLSQAGGFESVLANAKRRFCRKFKLEAGIALNHALMENLYVIVICILNRIPAFVVGKPGSSKTLAMQVIVSNLQGAQSPRPFWRRFPALNLFSFQCSPMTQAHGILEQFRMACNFQKHAPQNRTVLLLDEVGLAEHSPDMPLKVLHGILVDPPIAVIGISNWTLDAAKMNRAICLQRPEPREADLQLTGSSIIQLADLEAAGGMLSPEAGEGAGGGVRAPGDLPPPGWSAAPALVRSQSAMERHLQNVLGPLAAAYHAVYTNQPGGRDFIGMRDYYCTLKMLRGRIAEACGKKQGPSGGSRLRRKDLTWALCRNFGGRADLLRLTLETFHDKCYGQETAPQAKTTADGTKIESISRLVPPVVDLISGNLSDGDARHLMVLTRQSAALPLMLGAGLLVRKWD